MYICLCHGVTDKKIEQTIDDGAMTMRELSKELQVVASAASVVVVVKKFLIAN